MAVPVLAIVGRPNVGKSTLFNALIGKRTAIVGPEPGVTRDRVMAECEWNGLTFTVIDTGGIEFAADDMQRLVFNQVEVAIGMADVICFLTDLHSGLSDIEFKIAAMLRKSGKPIVVAVNKADRPGSEPLEFYQFYELGFTDTLAISASHKLGLSELLDAVTASMEKDVPEEEGGDYIAVAITGRPNVGKSSLANWMIGQERSIVSDIPGTTRDAIGSFVENDFGRFLIHDTAGLRRKARIDGQIEYVSALRSRRSVEGADVSVIMIDAAEGPAEQDTKVAGLAHNDGKASIILVNKWDLVDRKETSMAEYEEKIRRRFEFMPYAPILFVSVKTGFNLDKLWPLIVRVCESSRRRVPTSVLNEVIAEAIVLHPTPQQKGRHLRIYYVTQGSVSPPAFIFFVNDKRLLHFSYERYLENRLRENFDFFGTPLRFIWKGRAARDASASRITPD
ncbi:MAG TPA: ribosome biogenesis GTPase Der [Bacillota bacterium]|nr:ribosome biogenesis GTPase Der [Fastidiosipila sp.]HPX93926.1 ribosome biogenesis GTPase Der [Bacillota bacterium]HQB81830.1 ribosome biogenesis GTPase Der [Bacillota bacterium]